LKSDFLDALIKQQYSAFLEKYEGLGVIWKISEARITVWILHGGRNKHPLDGSAIKGEMKLVV
jgi:hypothetical protein